MDQKYVHKDMGRTIKRAGKGEAGVMRNLPSSVLHIRWVHCENMLGKEEERGHVEHIRLFIPDGGLQKNTNLCIRKHSKY